MYCHFLKNPANFSYICVAELRNEAAPAQAQHFLDNSVFLYFLVTALSCKMTDAAVFPVRNESIS